jgi:leader peptidase (prepilin peptidase)/N-methyltransferase
MDGSDPSGPVRRFPAIIAPDGGPSLECLTYKRGRQSARLKHVYSIFPMIREQIRIWGTVFAALLGLAFGSFLNVCLSRWPEGESIVTPRSHCRSCGRVLKWWENVPLVSWVALRGRCHRCGTRISGRYVVVEAVVGGLWALVAWRSLAESPLVPSMTVRPLAEGMALAVFLWLLVALAVLDAENLWIPDFLTLPGIGVGLLVTVLFEARGTSLLPTLLYRIIGLFAAAGVVLVIRWAYWLLRRREGIGLGDAKLMAMLAAFLGLPGALLAFGLGVVLGSAVAGVMLALPAARGEKQGLMKLPLGTFLCIGGIVSGLWGPRIIAAYLRWAGL